MIAAARQYYGGRWLVPGNEFEVKSESEADDLVAIHFATRAPKTYEREDMQAESASRPQTSTSQGSKHNSYRDRNLRAKS